MTTTTTRSRGSFYPNLVRVVGDVHTALLLSWIVDQDIPLSVTEEALSTSTGLSRVELDKARKRLDALGFIASQKSKKILTIVVSSQFLATRENVPRAADVAPARVVDVTQSSLPLLLSETPRKVETSEVNIRAVIAGDFDDVKPIDLAEVFLKEWARLLAIRSPRLSTSRAKVLRGLEKEPRVLPSTFAKAMHGMRWDEWEGRAQHCEWTFVVRNLEKWIGHFEIFGEASPIEKRTLLKTTTVTTTRGRKVSIPLDYVWTDSDSFMADQGYVFDVDTRRWESTQQ